MSRDVASDLKTLKLYLTERHPCSYLPGRTATTAFVDPSVIIDTNLYSNLSRIGFRRSGRYFYVPRCELCSACIPARIPVEKFRPTRSQRRCLKRNTGLTRHRVPLQRLNQLEHFSLYSRYIHERHHDGDMYPPSVAQFQDFIAVGHNTTECLELRESGQLVATAVTDVLDDGLSAIYTYFDPDYVDRGMGTFAILNQIELARELELSYLYLGYWIRKCRKMSYKTRFRSIQLYRHGRWAEFGSGCAITEN